MEDYVKRGEMEYTFLSKQHIGIWSKATYKSLRLSQLVKTNRGLEYVHYCRDLKGLIDNFVTTDKFTNDDYGVLIESNLAFWVAYNNIRKRGEILTPKEYHFFTFVDTRTHTIQKIYRKGGDKLKMRINTEIPHHA